MKDKVAFWGTNENDEEVLIALRLRPTDSKVDMYLFPKEAHDEKFFESVFQNWDDIDPDKFEQPFTHMERDMSEPSLLPDDIRTKSTDIVSRAEREWTVRVLSLKLAQKLEAEIGELEAQVGEMTDYDPELWNLSKTYWDKAEPTPSSPRPHPRPSRQTPRPHQRGF